MKHVSIIIPIYINNNNLFAITKKCIDQVVNETLNVETEIIIVDDASPNKKLVGFLENKFFPNLKWIHNSENMGFAKSINAGIKKSTKPLVLLLNNDVVIERNDWLDKLIKTMYHYEWDLTAPSEGILSKNNDYIPIKNRSSYDGVTFSYLVGWCMLIKREVISDVGMLPINFGRGFWEDTLYCRIIKNNTKYKMGVSKDIAISHMEHTTFKSIGTDLSKEYIEKRNIYIDIINGNRKAILPKIEDK